MKQPRLNRQLVLEAAQHTPDGAGGYNRVWVALGTVWAEVSARTGRERAGEALSLSSVPYRIVLRAAPVGDPSRPLPDQRFREGSRVYRIEAVTEQDREGRYLVCFAKEEVVS